MPETNNKMLQAHAERLLGLYQTVDEHVRVLESRESATASANDLEQISSLLSEASEAGAAMTAVRALIQSDGGSVPAAANEIIEAAKKVILHLMPRIAAMEKAAAEARAQLAPQIHAGVRALQMQNAYTRSP